MSETRRHGRLLIYAPVPLYRSKQNGFLQEDQACNGLRLWAESFEHVTVMMPVMEGAPPDNWQPIETVGPNLARITIVPLPEAYRPDKFLRQLPKVIPILRTEIEKADYLSFSIGGLFGDWGSISCILAHQMGRAYAVWTDRVESEVVRRLANEGSWRNRLRARLTHRPMAGYERYLIRRATLGLFHGKKTFDVYAPHCQNPQIVHDIHIKKSEHISPDQLAAKRDAALTGPLHISYAGRMDHMKGPFDWVKVLRHCADSGVDFHATWSGDGPLLDDMKAAVAEQGLSDRVSLPGFVNDRQKLLSHLRAAQVFLFCHKTPESPRCLIEALTSGTPIVGYKDAFAQDLVEVEKGGALVPLNDTEALAQEIIRLSKDRTLLSALIERAAKSGAQFDDETVFRHRSDVIKANLPRPAEVQP